MTVTRRSAFRRGVAAIVFLTAFGASAAPPQPVDLVVAPIDGPAFRLADRRGQWVLVNYWATWCSSCAAELPALSKLAAREPRLAIVGLTDEALPVEALRSFLAAHPVAYPIASVDAATLPAALAPTAFGIGMRPISYLIDPDGRVVERFLGAVDTQALERRIAASGR